MRLLFLAFLLNVCLSGIVFANQPQDYTIAREQFLLAEKYAQKGQWKKFLALKKSLKNYPLYPYLELMFFQNKLNTLTPEKLKGLETKYLNTPIIDSFKNQYLKYLAEHGQWNEFLSIYENNNHSSLACHALLAKNAINPKLNLQKESLILWEKPQSHAKICQQLFEKLELKKYLRASDYWKRIKLLFKKNNPKEALELAKNLEQNDQNLVKLWAKVHKKPWIVSYLYQFDTTHPATLEILVHGIQKMANKNPLEALRAWDKLKQQYYFHEHHFKIVLRSIAINLAQKHHPKALQWLKAIPENFVDEDVHTWRIRTALVTKNYPLAMEWIETLPKNLQDKEEWQYWKARLLAKQHKKQASQKIYNQLAKNRSYYGFLASLRLSVPYQLKHHFFYVSPTTIDKVSEKPGIQRARELHLMGKQSLANSEWFYALRKMSDVERHAAAKLSYQWNLHGWAIWALTKVKNKNDLNLRFPLAHTDHIFAQAQATLIDPAFILAVARQESAFLHSAHSPAGARGLMQLIPSTAKMMAKKHKLELNSVHELFDPKLNITLGSRYLQHLMEKYEQNPILTAAAYNAGPNNVKKWLPKERLDADIWIENIPFKETREYVKNVLTYKMIYHKLLANHPNYQPPLFALDKWYIE